MTPPNILALFSALLCIAPLAPAQAADNPWKADRPVTLVVPYSPGGSTDALARAIAKSVTAAVGQPIIVENVSGADGLIGTRRVIDSRPDGYTLLMQLPAMTITKLLPDMKGVDPLAGLAPLSAIAETPVILVVSAKLPVQTFGEFVQYCRTAPKPCSIGTTEIIGRVRASQIAAEAKLPNLVSVNYRGTSQSLTDLIGGNIDMALANPPAILGHYKSGNVKLLAVQDKKRSPVLPGIPTTAEAGYPQFQMVTWFGLFAPKGTPGPMLEKIAAALRAAGADPDFKRAVDTAGGTIVLNSPAEFAAQVRHDEETWGHLVKLYPLGN